MRPSWFGAFLLLACARPPSAAPLGGEEWLPAERTYDRKPRDATERAARDTFVVEVSASKPSEASGAVPAASADRLLAVTTTPIKSGEFEFTTDAFKKGDLITLETRIKIDGAFGAQSMLSNAYEKIEVRVNDVNGDTPREVEVSYVVSESSSRFGDNETNEKPNANKRFRVRLDGKKPEVTRLDSSSKDKDKAEDDAKGVVFDLGTVTGYLPLLQKRLPARIKSGFKTELTASELGTVFGEFQSVKLERAWLTLQGGSEGADPVARFDCGMPVQIGRGALNARVDLKGSCSVRPRGTRPVDMSLRGNMQLASGAPPGMPISGSLEASFHYAYSR